MDVDINLFIANSISLLTIGIKDTGDVYIIYSNDYSVVILHL